MRKALTVAIAGLLLATCDSGDGSGDLATTTTTAAPTTAVQETTTSLPGTTSTQISTTNKMVGGSPEAPSVALEIATTEDLIFHQGDERFDPSSGYMDVIAPVVDGPWPTVVVFHGEGATKAWHRPDATMLARQGRVVFLPNWSWTDVAWRAANGTRADFELILREAACALVYAREHAAEFGGDPDHITVYGYSAGGNAALMASLAGVIPVEICAEPGEVVIPQAVVAIDADWLVAPHQWDSDLIEDPELFYAVTPYRALDGSHSIPVHTMTTETTTGYRRAVSDDPAKSWFTYRHTDVDLGAELEELGFLEDGYVDVQEFSGYGHHVLAQRGYETTFTVLPNSSHAWWSDEARSAVVERVLHAEEGI